MPSWGVVRSTCDLQRHLARFCERLLRVLDRVDTTVMTEHVLVDDVDEMNRGVVLLRQIDPVTEGLVRAVTPVGRDQNRFVHENLFDCLRQKLF